MEIIFQSRSLSIWLRGGQVFGQLEELKELRSGTISKFENWTYLPLRLFDIDYTIITDEKIG